MTVRRPLYLQGLTGWSADDDRRLIDAVFQAPGVIDGALAVGPNSPVAMNVVVQTGYVVVPAKTAGKGKYVGQVTAPEVVTIQPASANNRTDIVVAQVLDTVDGADGSDVLQIVAIMGVTDGSNVPPATPANATLLATVQVLSTDSTVVAGRITDKRPNLFSSVTGPDGDLLPGALVATTSNGSVTSAGTTETVGTATGVKLSSVTLRAARKYVVEWTGRLSSSAVSGAIVARIRVATGTVTSASTLIAAAQILVGTSGGAGGFDVTIRSLPWQPASDGAWNIAVTVAQATGGGNGTAGNGNMNDQLSVYAA